ncbi:hypothetical protein [Undibacterium griseum]|uniref:Ig-like domain-containing protein n=1 Tax=Undibacterium griseum TaxID=2762295 RepID=A0ABR6YI51_9BURK|nr:hypothetical protein [Undibacterium griseum]MBC3883538.1 hypothetical protein [Undibacterium griseum]
MYSEIRFTLLAAASLLLAACGGGGSSSSGSAASPVIVSVPAPSTVSSGDALSFTGQASSSAGQITKMYWQIDTLTLGANALTSVTNADCKSTTTSGNTVNCVLQVTPPAKLTADYTYKLSFFAVDAKGNTSSSSTTLQVLQSASVTNNPTVQVGADATVTSGDKVSLNCSGSGGTPAATGDAYSYQWVVNDAAGLTISLAGTTGAANSFVAPVVKTATTVKLQCRVTDDKQKTGTAIQKITINPVVKPTVVPISYSGGTVQPGAAVSLDGSKTVMYDANGNLTSGTIYYLWQFKSGPASALPLQVYNATSSVASVVFPSVVTATSMYVFTLNASTAPIAADGTSADPVKQRDVVFVVSPLPPITLTSYNLVQVVQSGASVQLKAETPNYTGSAPLYFSWTQTSLPVVALVGTSSQIAGFIAPTVTVATTLTFRVSADYQPITVANPGSASVDLLVQVLPKS